MTTEPLYAYDPAAALDGPEAIAVFLSDALETGDAAYNAVVPAEAGTQGGSHGAGGPGSLPPQGRRGKRTACGSD